MPALLRLVLICLALLSLGTNGRGGVVSYTDRGKADFDVFMQALNPYGTWSKIDGLWAYTPLAHEAPYTHGRWIYTEYGWYWKGAQPHSWATEHYGYWKRGADKVWSWYPGPYWLPSIVEIRGTSTHVGWRSAAVNREGDFLEKPEDRYAKTDEWTFVSMEQFANPITPDRVADPELTKSLLDDSSECRHIYVTYREIDRPGPHPADFLPLSKDGGTFAPETPEQKAAAPPSAIISGLTPGFPVTPAARTTPSTNAAPLTATNAAGKPVLTPDQISDRRQVRYWITMSLPTFWSKPPDDAKVNEIYLYRPDCFQDEDGISRRLELWLYPNSRKTATQRLNEVLGGNGMPTVKTDADTNGAPAAPAQPALPAKREPFKSPFDDSFHSDNSRSPGSKVPASPPSVPATNSAPNGLVPPPTTNAAPAGKR